MNVKTKKILSWTVCMIPFIILISLFFHQKISQHIEIKNQELSKNYIDQMIIPSDNDCNIELIKNVTAPLYKLDHNICKKLLNKGLKIKFVKNGTSPEFKDKLYKNEPFAGYYVHSEKTIYYRLDQSGLYFPKLQFHELGHAIDYLLLNNISCTVDFYKIFCEEASNLFGNEYYNSSEVEYFAESFAWYYLEKSTYLDIKKHAPQTYEYMNRMVTNLIEN